MRQSGRGRRSHPLAACLHTVTSPGPLAVRSLSTSATTLPQPTCWTCRLPLAAAHAPRPDHFRNALSPLGPPLSFLLPSWPDSRPLSSIPFDLSHSRELTLALPNCWTGLSQTRACRLPLAAAHASTPAGSLPQCPLNARTSTVSHKRSPPCNFPLFWFGALNFGQLSQFMGTI